MKQFLPLLAWLVLSRAAIGQRDGLEYRTVALSGFPVSDREGCPSVVRLESPGACGDWFQHEPYCALLAPAISDSGDVVFHGYTASGIDPLDGWSEAGRWDNVFRWSGGRVETLLYHGQHIDATQDTCFSSGGHVQSVAANGDVLLRLWCRDAENTPLRMTTALVRCARGNTEHEVVWCSGAPLPTVSGWVTPRIGPNSWNSVGGSILMLPDVATQRQHRGIWRWTQTGIEVLLDPSLPIAEQLDGAGVDAVVVAACEDNGIVVFASGTNDAGLTQGLRMRRGAGWHRLGAEGDFPAPLGNKIFHSLSMAPGGLVAGISDWQHEGALVRTLWRHHDGKVEVIVDREATLPTLGNRSWRPGCAIAPEINQNGDILVVMGCVSKQQPLPVVGYPDFPDHPDDSAVCVFRAEKWEPVAVDGEQVPGLESGVTFGDQCTLGRYSPVLGRSGHIVIRTLLRGPGVDPTNNTALILADPDGAISVVVREGEDFDVSGEGRDIRRVSFINVRVPNRASGQSPINAEGTCVFALGFSDGSSGVFTARRKR